MAGRVTGHRRRLLAAAVIAGVALLSGCGESGKERAMKEQHMVSAEQLRDRIENQADR